MKRREFLKGIVAAAAVTAVSKRSWAGGMDESEKVVDYLFVQNAHRVSLKDNILSLKGIASDTLYFSDRPDRIVGRVTTEKFVDTWAKGHDSFKKDPPNAVLSILHGTETQDIVVVLKKPMLKGDDLIYDVKILDGNKTVSGNACTLFIDEIGRPLTPLSYAGMARRTSRRTARRVARRR